MKTLESCKGSRTDAANLLGISTRTLRNKLHEYGEMTAFKENEQKVDSITKEEVAVAAG
jgi:DNA-binding NtrC family response regulator